MNAEALIDTNLLVYAYTDADKQKRQISLALLDQVWKGKKIFSVSLQNLSEFYSVVTSKVKIPISKRDACGIVEAFCNSSFWVVLIPNPESLSDAMSLSEEQGISIWDAQIISVAKQNRVRIVFTENVKDFKLPGIEVINPFRTLNTSPKRSDDS